MEELVAVETSLNNDTLPPVRIRLGSKSAIKKTLARLIRETMDDKRDSADLSRLVNALQVLFSMQDTLDKEGKPDEEMDPYSPEQEAADEEKLRARGWTPSSGGA